MYTSTRSKMNIKTSRAIIDGIAKDKGLFVKKIEKIFSKEELIKLSKLSYQELAFEIMGQFIDFDKESLKEIIKESYKDTFDDAEIVKLKSFGDLSFLELYHGKTLAFKDVALSVLPNLLKYSKVIENEKNKSIILTATSGDTGSAALCGFSKDENTKMIVLYPTYGVSKIQEQQMLSFDSKNQKVIGIDGNFDDAQNLVKRAFNDEINKDMNLSSANSINIGRLIPQIVYYFYSYFNVTNLKENSDKELEKINFVVPTGNFGNILAGYIAKKMGLPVNKLICASNSNNVLYDFFNKKEYNKNRDFIKTISPSMDILISSNLERLLYYILEDDEEVKKLMEELQEKGSYKFNKDIDEFYSEYASENETYKGIKEVYEKYNYLIDPHTSVGYIVYKKYLENVKNQYKTIVLSTAHPYKFPLAICKALNIECLDEFDGIDKLNKLTNVKIPQPIIDLQNINRKKIWKKEEAYEKLCDLIKELHND